MNQNEYVITRFKNQVADMTERIYDLNFRCILLSEENEKLKARINELESRLAGGEPDAESV